ncbi:restriction endonuclease subunit S [Candidatus Parcubacteria bacterium]|nr:restriction endonuclease subunit S [Candidatus Parcubacteria bacterium]
MKKNKLGNFVKIRTGKLDANASSSDGDYPFFTCSKKPLKISSYSYDCKCVLVAGNGDLNVKYYEGKFDAYQRTYIIESKDELILDTRYLYWFLEKYVEKLRELSIGGVIKYIKINNLTDPIIPLPSLEAQKHIVKIFDETDALCQKRKQAIKFLDDYLKSVFLEMFGDPVRNPNKIKKIKIKEMGKVLTGNTPPRNNPKNYGSFVEWIKSDNINNGNHYLTKATEYLSEDGCKKARIVPACSILITCIAGSLSCIGNVSMADRKVAFNQQINAVIPNSNVDQFFLYAQILFNKELFQKASTNSMKGMLNKSKFLEIELLMPDIKLQKKYSFLFLKTESIKQKMLIQSKELEIQFQSLMQKAFKGEL